MSGEGPQHERICRVCRRPLLLPVVGEDGEEHGLPFGHGADKPADELRRAEVEERRRGNDVGLCAEGWTQRRIQIRLPERDGENLALLLEAEPVSLGPRSVGPPRERVPRRRQ